MNFESLEPILYLPDDTPFYPEHGDDRHYLRLLWRAAGLAALCAVAYLPVLIWGGLVWQDEVRVTQNVLLWSWNGLGGIWLHPVAGAYRPVAQVLFWIEHHYFKTTPQPYHFVSLFLHCANVGLLWMVLRRLNVRGAWLGAALFALHPVQVQAVSWISQQPHLLAAGFDLGAVWAFLRLNRIYPPFPEEFNVAAGDDIEDFMPLEPVKRLYGLTLVLAILAALTDPLGIVLPLVLLILLWWKKGKVAARQWLQLAPLLAIALIATIIACLSARNVADLGGAGAMLSVLGRIDVAGRAIWTYALRTIWPEPLQFVYSRWSVEGWQIIFPLGIAAVGVGCWMARRILGRTPMAALLLFITLLLPAIWTVLGTQTPPIYIADHLQYLAAAVPLAGIAAGIVSLLSFVPTVTWVRAARTAAAVACCGGLGFLVWQLGFIYQDEPTAWKDTLAQDPGSSVARTQYAQYLLARGKDLEAERLLRESPDRDREDVALLQSRGQLYLSQARYADAVDCFQRAHQIESENIAVVIGLGVAYAKNGQTQAAADLFTEALAKHPEDPSLQTSFAEMVLYQGNANEAIEHFQAALRSDPRYIRAKIGLAVAYFRMRNPVAAADQLQQAVAIDPQNYTAYDEAGRMVGELAYVVDPKQKLECLGIAEEMFKQAVRLRPSAAETWNNLGVVQAAQGKNRLGDAVWNFDRAVHIKPGYQDAQRNLDQARRELASSER